MTTTPSREIGRSSALLMTGRWCDKKVDVERPLPGIIIVVHGVNDTGANYHAFDNGLCAGLNERLDRDDLFPNDYTLPVEGEDVVPDPDKVFYRLRNNDKTRSPVIPFYWGYRAHPDDVAKKLVNNEVVDVHGNRLDRDFAKGGGMFANATSTIPDMFGGHFRVGLTVLLARLGSDAAHPLRDAPDRRYMALAAKRLQALIETIHYFDPDETITVIGHSQGCLVALLAQAWLKRPADCLILNHPPYGLHEPGLDRRTQTGDEQQTSRARIETLVNIVNKVCCNPHPSPSLESLKEAPDRKGTAGSKWLPHQGMRAGLHTCEQLVFTERDNRGKVYLYFCPHDLTVGLSNVRGIGTFGVPDTLEYTTADGENTPKPILERLGSGFFQRVWTWRERNGSHPAVGLPSPYRHVLRLDGEKGHDAMLDS